MADAYARAVNDFVADHGHPPPIVARAPGRVNLIGEHTDYNDGFVLPIALPFDTVIAAEPLSVPRIRVRSAGFGATEFAIGADPGTTVGWARYIHGVAALLAADGWPVSGWSATIATDIPAGASLSSSAALEVSAALVALATTGSTAPGVELAKLGQRVENEVMGLPSGIMDQLASATAVRGHASLIDCRSLEVTPVPLPDDVQIVVMDTGTRRELVESAYADRQSSCARAASALGVAALRDAALGQWDDVADPLDRRRARHVITEDRRTLAAVAAMEANDVGALGRLMVQSHASLRDDFEVSSPALDRMVDLALAVPGCHGARMTGGGFAGGSIALVDRNRVEEFVDRLSLQYRAPDSQPASAPAAFYAVDPSSGAAIVAGDREERS